MSGFYAIFDYFKEAFHINRDNKVLYKPQIVLILLRSLAIFLMGIYLYSWSTKPSNLRDISNGEYSSLFWGLGIFFVILIILVLIFAILSLVVEAGLLNMYKSGVTYGNVSMDIFWEGVSKYFFKLILGHLLIMVGMSGLVLAFIIVSISTLGVGFIIMIMFSAIIALLIQLFLSMWKVSLVMDDLGVVEAFKYSMKFIKNNFWPFLILQIIHWSFAGGSRGGGLSNFRLPGSSSSSGDGGNSSDLIPREGADLLPNKEEILNTVSKLMKIGIAVAIPVITIITAVGTLISMIFEVFFSLSLFVAYKYQFKQPINPQEEVTL